MKLQFNILLNNIKKYLMWYIIFILLLATNIIVFYCMPDNYVFNDESFWSLLCIPNMLTHDFINDILCLYQIVLHVFFTYVDYIYEFDKCYDSVLLRINEFKWILSKLISIIFYTILVKVFETFILYILFRIKFSISFQFNYFFSSIVFMLFLSGIIIMVLNIFRLKSIFSFLLVILLGLISFFHFSLFIFIIVDVILYVYIVISFRIKKVLKDK